MSRIFLSHSSLDSREAVALKQWLAEQDPPLANEIFLDVDPNSGLRTGTRWKDALRRANARCEAVICLLSPNWEASQECRVEYRTAENLNKQIFMARLGPSTGDDLTSEWQRCDLFGDGPRTQVDVGGGAPVDFATHGLYRLRDGIRGAGIGAESFVWPPPGDPGRAPYRGWEPLDSTDAAVFFGRDAQIIRALDAVRGMRRTGVNSLFVVLGPSGTGKSSFLRAGLLPRLRREDRRFVVMEIVRPERNPLTGDAGLAPAIYASRRSLGIDGPSLGEVKAACAAGEVERVAEWLTELRDRAADQLLERGGETGGPVAPTLVLPLDQAEELLSADAGEQSDVFLRLLAGLAERLNTDDEGLIVTATIRTDRYEIMQTHPLLAGVGTVLFDELKPMPANQFKEVIVGPAQRSTEGGHPLQVAPDLVERLLEDAGEGADTLPMLALTLARLYTDYGSTGEMSLAHYEAMGGMRRVVQTEIDDVLSSDPAKRPGELEALRAAFIPWLATVNPENDQPMRRVARWSDLPEASRPLIDALVGKRLMVKDTRDGETIVEVALESLLRQWDELAWWLREQRKDLKDADDMERASAAWALNERDHAWLLSGTRLTEAETLSNTTGFRQRLAGTADYLAASRDAENRRLAAEDEQRQVELCAAQERQATAEAHTATLRKRSRILRAVLAVTAVVAVVAAVGFVRANAANNEAQRQFREATSERLTAEAQGMQTGTRSGNDIRAMQQLLAARLLTQTPDDNALYDTVIQETTTSKIVEVGFNVFSPQFSPDGRLMASGGGDGNARIWDAASGQPKGGPLEGHTGVVGQVAFSPDARLLATSSHDGTVRLWEVDSGQTVGQPLAAGAVATSLVFSKDGRRLVVGGNDGVVRVWDVDTTNPVGAPLRAPGREAELAISPDGGVVAADTGDGAIGLWDIETGRDIGQLTGHADTLAALAFSSDGRRLASASYDMTVRLWDVDALRQVGEPLQHTREVLAVAFSPDGHRLVSSVQNNLVVWNLDTGQTIGGSVTGHGGIVFGLAFHPDGRHVASGASDGDLRLWDVASREFLAGRAVAFTPDGRQLVTGGADGAIRMWDRATRLPLGRPFVGHTGAVSSILFSADGRLLASGGADGTVRFWDVESGQLIGPQISAGATSLALSPDGRRLVTGDKNGLVHVWDTDTGQQIGSPFGTQTQWGVLEVALLSDGREVGAVYYDGAVKVWDVSSRDERLTGDVETVATTAAFSPSGQYAVGSLQGGVTFYRAGTAEWMENDATGHTGMVTAMSFSSDGHRTATGSRDHDVRMWNADTGMPIGKSIAGLTDEVASVALSSDGRFLAAASIDAAVRVWPASASPEDLCAKLTANMSDKQWDEWVSPDIDYVKTCPDLPVAPD